MWMILLRDHLVNYNAIGLNNDFPQDKIYYYSLGYYSVWEAEEVGDISRTGFVHHSGNSANWRGVRCWTNSTSAQACSLLYGPHYKQDKDWKDFGSPVSYTARYWLALDYDSARVDPNTEICKLYVTERYTKIVNRGWTGPYVDILATLTLKASDFFGSGGNFKYFDLKYQYPAKFLGKNIKKTNINLPDTIYSDVDDDNGIEFKLDYLGENSRISNLFSDKVEVYDNRIWTDYIKNPTGISKVIKDYALSFMNSGNWNNIKYWYACDEPRGIDNYLPLHIIDSLLESVRCPHLITEMYPPWNTTLNGDTLLKKYVEIAQPHTLMIDSYPFENDGDIAGALETLRKRFAVAHRYQPDFWYVGQGFGEQDPVNHNVWHIWKKPDPSELKATVMLALAHGAKGIMFWNYWSYPGHQPLCNCAVIHNGLVTDEEQPKPTELWYLIKNDLAPRLRGTLGNTLLTLNYSGQFLHILKNLKRPPGEYPANGDYLSLSSNGDFYSFYAGLLQQKNRPDNKYFLLVNLRTDSKQSVAFTVNNNFNFNNIRIKNVEDTSIMDTTIKTQLISQVRMNPGEGSLFQVAPVVKYGGKLYYNETVTNLTLYDDMTIENGVTLTVNGTYKCYANIYTEGTGKIKTLTNGVINFNGSRGIIAR